MENKLDTIKTLWSYSNPVNFFIDRIPKYIKESGDVYIPTRRAFNEIMGMAAGVHAARYKEKIWNVHLMAFVAALKELEKMGLVKRWGPSVWKWVGDNGGEYE